MTFLDRLNLTKCDFTQNWRGGKIIKFQQSQALTSHFESFWSIVNNDYFFLFLVPSRIQDPTWSQIPYGFAYWYCSFSLWRMWQSIHYKRQTASSSKISAFKRETSCMRMVWKRIFTCT